MKILPKIIILLLSIIIGVLIILPSLIESKSVQINFQNKLTSKFQTNFNIQSDIDISFLPRPKITIRDVSVNNFITEDGHVNINFDSISIIPRISSLFGPLKIKEVIFRGINANYVISYEDLTSKTQAELKYIPQVNQDFIANKIFNFDKSDNKIFDIRSIGNVVVINSRLSITDINGTPYSNYTDLSIEMDSDLSKGRVYAEGSFVSDGMPTIFNLDVSTKSDDVSRLTINSPILQGDISGKFFDTESLSITKSNFDGKINLSISNLKLLLNKYFSQKSLIFRNINNTEDIELSSNLFLKDGVLSIENINIDSSIIKGSGKVVANNLKEDKSIELDLSIDYLNFDDLWIGKFQPIKDKYLNDAITNIVDGFQNNLAINHKKFPKLDISIFGLLLKSNINIKKLEYKDQILTDILISMSTSDNKQIKLDKFELNLKDNSKLQITGVIENIGSLIKLEGYMVLNSGRFQDVINLSSLSTSRLKQDSLRDFRARSKILILPNTTILKEIQASLNKKSIISGDIFMIEGGDILDASYNLNFNQLKLEDYFPKNYLEKFTHGNAFLQNFLSLNNIDINHKLSLKFGRLSYEDFHLTNQSFNINIGRGTIDMPALLVDQGQNNSNIKLYLDVYSPIPILNFSLSSSYLSIDDLSKESSSDKFRSNFLNYFFDFPSLVRFDGNIDVDIEHLNFNNIKINDLLIRAPFKEGVVNIEKASASLFGGEIDISGDLILNKQKRLNNSFQLLGIENKIFLSKLFNISNIESKSNVSGIIMSYAKNREEFYKNLNLQAKFTSVGVVMKKFGIGDLLIEINKDPNSINNVKDIILSDSAKTIFRKVTGSIDIRPNDVKKEIYINTESVGLNSITSGTLDLKNNQINIGHNSIIIAVTPNRKTIPLRFALNASGPIDNLSLSPNFSQINQYLKIQ
ncbi:MAG: hypothetical protein ACI9IL_000016 [Rickettsiales bacterium]|jgi:hypothetical protein